MGAFDGNAFDTGFTGTGTFTGDIFDQLLISTCSILVKGAGTNDTYGVESQGLTPVASEVKCRVSALSGREWKQGKKVSVNTKKIFMRPFSGLTEHHVIQVGTTKYDITDIENPSRLDHHYEVLVEEVKP